MGLESLEGIVSGILLKRRAEPEESDYYCNSDGLLYCGNCHTAKECRIEVAGETFTVPCLCKCGEDAYEENERKFREQQRRIRIGNLRVSGILDENLRRVRFDDSDDCENIRKCRKFVEHWGEIRKQNTGLLMTGPVGTGKTYAAACIANALIDRGIPVLMTSFPAILSTSKFELNDIVRQSQEYDLVIVDDLGVERDTEYSAETVYQYIDARYRSGKPLIVTTNLSLQDMKEPGGIRYKRIYDRILEMCVPMVFSGESRRVEKRKEKAYVLREILYGKG